MKQIIAIITILTILLFTGCALEGETTEQEPSVHTIYVPKADGTMQQYLVVY